MKQLTLGQLEEAIMDLKETVEFFELATFALANGVMVQVELVKGEYVLNRVDSIEKVSTYVSRYNTTELGVYNTFADVEGRLFELYC